eukprot:TRINITY_DN2660_c0_g1_i1.p1 TRINITY_DN2660_c0_g1~~TRINITY_DN2660_c0_g1_i1.p1  ORF type:complete len:538 (+),score=91.84 TRINITY_DN2660_c0_g1_i1:291-1904(+)
MDQGHDDISYTPPIIDHASRRLDRATKDTCTTNTPLPPAQNSYLTSTLPSAAAPVGQQMSSSQPTQPSTMAVPSFVPPPNASTTLPPPAALTPNSANTNTERELQSALQQLLWYHHYINWLGMMNQIQQQATVAYQHQQQLRRLQEEQRQQLLATQAHMTTSQSSASSQPQLQSQPHAHTTSKQGLRSASIIPQGSTPHPAVANQSARPATSIQNQPSLTSPAFPPFFPGSSVLASNPLPWSPAIPNTSLASAAITRPDPRPPSGLNTSPLARPSPLPSPFLAAAYPGRVSRTPSQRQLSPLDAQPPMTGQGKRAVVERDSPNNELEAKRPKSETSLETAQGCGVDGQSWISLAQLCEMDDWNISKCTRHIPCHRPKGSLAWVVNWVKGLQVPSSSDSDAYEAQQLEADMPASDAFTPTHAASSTYQTALSTSSGRRRSTSALKYGASAGKKPGNMSTTQLAKREKHRELLRDTNHLTANIERLNSKCSKLRRKMDRLQAKVLTKFGKTMPPTTAPKCVPSTTVSKSPLGLPMSAVH